MVLRGVREGSVPRALLEELLTEIDSSTPERLSHLLVQMLNDLGVGVNGASKLRVFSRAFSAFSTAARLR